MSFEVCRPAIALSHTESRHVTPSPAIAPGLSFLEQATCPAIPAQTLHSHYMNAGQQKARRGNPG